MVHRSTFLRIDDKDITTYLKIINTINEAKEVTSMDEKIIKEYFLEDDPSFEIVKTEKMQHLEGRYYKVFSKDATVEVFIDDNDNVQILPE